MQDVKGFRRYYNEHLHSELLVFERRRKRLVAAIIIGNCIMVLLTLLTFSLGVAALSLFLVIPWGGLMQISLTQIRKFKEDFKPLVVSSVLRFIDPRLKYMHKEFIPRDTFMRSNIFPVNPEVYTGEDYIMGKIGEVSFEMCELELFHPSETKNKLIKIFEGVFFHANFQTKFDGRIVIFPRTDWQGFIKTMKSFTRYGGYELKGLGSEAFQKEFIVYVDRGMAYKEVLSNRLLDIIEDYHIANNKKMYVSFVDNHFYIALAEPYELLEAHIFLSNLDFDLIASFYEELFLFTRIVEDFDLGH